jgi:hypothetical protein
MSNKPTLQLPLSFIFFDVIGFAALGLGLAKLFGGIDIIPLSMQFENYGLALVLLGVLMMMPMMSYIFNFVRANLNKN